MHTWVLILMAAVPTYYFNPPEYPVVMGLFEYGEIPVYPLSCFYGVKANYVIQYKSYRASHSPQTTFTAGTCSDSARGSVRFLEVLHDIWGREAHYFGEDGELIAVVTSSEYLYFGWGPDGPCAVDEWWPMRKGGIPRSLAVQPHWGRGDYEELFH